jgi:opacity protein-like surface antigen
MNAFRIACAAAALLAATAASAEWVNGYFRSDGTYVQGHYRSSPDSNRYNNYGSKSYGGTQRDEFSTPGATNRSNPAWGLYDNDGDGLYNGYDFEPEDSYEW